MLGFVVSRLLRAAPGPFETCSIKDMEVSLGPRICTCASFLPRRPVIDTQSPPPLGAHPFPVASLPASLTSYCPSSPLCHPRVTLAVFVVLGLGKCEETAPGQHQVSSAKAPSPSHITGTMWMANPDGRVPTSPRICNTEGSGAKFGSQSTRSGAK